MKTGTLLLALLGLAAMLRRLPLRINCRSSRSASSAATPRMCLPSPIFNDPKNDGDMAGFKVVAAFPAGTDIPDSKDRAAKFNEIRFARRGMSRSSTPSRSCCRRWTWCCSRASMAAAPGPGDAGAEGEEEDLHRQADRRDAGRRHPHLRAGEAREDAGSHRRRCGFIRSFASSRRKARSATSSAASSYAPVRWSRIIPICSTTAFMALRRSIRSWERAARA